MKYLVTLSSICIFIASSSTGELFSQPIRGNVRQTGRMFPEHVEQSFMNPEYSFVTVWWILWTIREAKVHLIKNQLYLLNTPNYVSEQMFTQLRTSKNWFFSLFVLPWYNCTGWLGIKKQVTYVFLIYALWSLKDSLPWYNCTGWLGVKHQLTYSRIQGYLFLYTSDCPDITTLVDWA